MTLLDARGLTKSFGARVVLDAVDLSIAEGERVGVVGVNGSGKSTLAKILGGEETPDAGEIAVRRGANVLYLSQQPTLAPDRSVLETALRGLSNWWEAHARHERATRALETGTAPLSEALEQQAAAAADLERLGGWDVRHRAEALLDRLQLNRHDARVDTLSGGEQRRLALARLLVAEPALAILDEPTNHLDLETVEWLEQHLASSPGACLLITHDRYLLDRVATRTLEVDGGKVYSYDGGYARYREAKAERLAHAERAEANRQNFLRRELEWLRRSPKARSTKQKARVARAETALATGGPARQRDLQLEVETSRLGRTILELRGVAIQAPDGRTLVRDLDLTLSRGDRLGIVGPNGAGKTTLLRTVLGELPPGAGEIILGKNTEVAYLSQLRHGLDPEATVLENVAGGRTHVKLASGEMHAMAYLERFLFTREQARTKVAALSGGERTRVALARLLKQSTNLLVLDEPTNDLDVDTLAALEDLICEQQGTALVVTHDRWFLDRIATGILAFEGDARVVRYAGGYSEVKAQRQREAEARRRDDRETGRPPQKSRSAERGKAPRDKPKLSFKEARELEAVEAEIARLEARVRELEELLSDPQVYQERAEEVSSWVRERDEAEAHVLERMERWEVLEAKRSG